ncbi:MAG: response regulator [Anaerolineales bacterium]|nr:response regulator [Anaerolineales bacterium]
MTNQQNLSVLVVDDTAAIRERVMSLISNVPGVEALEAVGSAKEAYARMKERMPDVLILDVFMPEVNGIEMLRAIKKTKPSPVIIMFTSYPFPQYRDLCMKAGADFFFEKSTEFNLIAGTLASLARERTFDATDTHHDAKFHVTEFDGKNNAVKTGGKA